MANCVHLLFEGTDCCMNVRVGDMVILGTCVDWSTAFDVAQMYIF